MRVNKLNTCVFSLCAIVKVIVSPICNDLLNDTQADRRVWIVFSPNGMHTHVHKYWNVIKIRSNECPVHWCDTVYSLILIACLRYSMCFARFIAESNKIFGFGSVYNNQIKVSLYICIVYVAISTQFVQLLKMNKKTTKFRANERALKKSSDLMPITCQN